MKSITKAGAVLLLCAVILLPATAGAVIIEKIAARVNSQVITMYDLREKVSDMRDLYRQMRKRVPADIQKQALDKLINQQLVIQQAKQEGIIVSDMMVKQQIQQLLKTRAWTMEMLKQELKKKGMTVDKLQQQFRQQTMLKQLFKKRKGDIGNIKPTEAEIQAFYDKQAPKEKRVMHLYIRLAPGAGFTARTKIEKRIDAVSAALKRNPWQFMVHGRKFADVVRDYGYMTPREVMEKKLPKYLFPAFSLNRGRTRVFRVTTELPRYPGFHALFVAGERKVPLQKIKDVIERRLQEEKFNDALQKWVKKLRKSASIKINI